MSAVVDCHAHDHRHGHGAQHDRHGGYSGNVRWLTTIRRKVIGTLYLAYGLPMCFFGFANFACEILSNEPGSPLWS
jgi:hypothetical protein